MKRNRFFVLATAVVAAVTMYPVPAGAEGVVYDGGCIATMRVEFTNNITMTSGPPDILSWRIQASCVSNAEPLDPIEQFVASSSNGSATIGTCGVIQFNSLYAGGFPTQPGPPPTSGGLSFYGSSAGGTLVMMGSDPTFLGVGTFAGLSSVACTTIPDGTRVFNYAGPFIFADP